MPKILFKFLPFQGSPWSQYIGSKKFPASEELWRIEDLPLIQQN